MSSSSLSSLTSSCKIQPANHQSQRAQELKTTTTQFNNKYDAFLSSYLLLLLNNRSSSSRSTTSWGSNSNSSTATRANIQDEILNVALLKKLSKQAWPERFNLHIGCFNQFCNLLCLKTLVKESEKIHRSA